jgi:SAM-dependent methyltransferase
MTPEVAAMFRTSSHIYDLIYEASGKDYAAEAAVVGEIIQGHNNGAATLLDVACGTGAHLRHLRSRYEVVGLDLDPGMLEQAGEALPGVTLVQGDMRSFRLARRFDAVVCLFSSIGYMRSVQELDAAVGNMAAHLSASGVLVIDGWIRPDAWIDPGTVHAEAARGDGVAAARVGKSRREGNKTYLELHHLVGTLDGIEYLVDHHELTLFTDDQYQDAFRRSGLSVQRVDSQVPGRDRYIGVAPVSGRVGNETRDESRTAP